MKNIIVIGCINFILIIIFFIILDFTAHTLIVTKENNSLVIKPEDSIVKLYLKKHKFKKDYDAYFIYNERFRPVENKNSKKEPIVIFGCSFAYGNELDNDETFSHQLGELTDRPIYNRAYSGWSPKQMVYQLQNENFYKTVPKPEYVIYVFYPGQISRFYINTKIAYPYNLFYKNENGTLKRDKLNEFLLNSSIVYMIKRKYIPWEKNNYTENDIDLLIKHFYTAREEIDKHWGKDVKFVILLYGHPFCLHELIPVFDVLNNNNFTIINANDIFNKNLHTPKYQIGKTHTNKVYDGHPNAKAWKEITPNIVKILHL